jgi:hypothetical protein
MSRQDPGLQYPADIPQSVDPSIHKSTKMIVDNLFHLKGKMEKMEAANVASTSAKTGAAAAGGTESGTYIPIIQNVLNVVATPFRFQYMKVGSVVTVSGRVDVDPAAANTTQVGISLPIPTQFTKADQCCGVAACPSIAGQSASIQADPGSNRALMQWVAVDTTNQSMFLTFTYLLN